MEPDDIFSDDMEMQHLVRLVSLFLLAPVLGAALGTPAASAPLSTDIVKCVPGAPGIDEARFVSIGGVEQWITIRGANCANPVILFLHGGPGNTLSPFAGNIYGAWEKEFTLVQWDQRGAGRTFGRNPGMAESTLTIDLMTRDGIELAAHVAAHLSKKKLILMGGSWGSVLGVHMAKSRPDLFHAYLGTGQLVSYRENQDASYRKLLALARTAGDTTTVTALEALGPPPWTNPRSFGIVRRATRSYEARTSTPAPESWWVPSELYATEKAQADYEGGEDFSYLQFVGLEGQGMLSLVNLPGLGASFEVPVFIVQGSEDLVTTPEVAKRYFDTITAPRKHYVSLPRTGHDPNSAMIDAQYDILKNRIVPVVN